VMRRFFADRSQFISDPDFTKVPVAALTSRAYADERRKTIDLQRASKSSEVGPGNPASGEPAHTTHFAIVDKDGAMVSNTYTINDWFGAGVTAKGTGILLNDEMDDFTAQPGVPNVYGLIQGEKNAIEPRKRPLSSMCPLIMLDHGKPWVAVGAAGGPRIITTVLQIVMALVDYGMNLQEALDAPRLHHQWMPDEIWWEPRGVNPDTRAILERMGHTFRDHAANLSDANAVEIDPETGLRVGASDPRRGGVAIGY
jgi:gamma-glutamyltranspeptidase/glutathione hydrolase